MIDEYWTWTFYGYHSDGWADGSHKPIVVVCDECGKYRVLRKCDYRDLCKQCALRAQVGENHPFFGKRHTPQTKKMISEKKQGVHPTEETRKKMSVSGKNKPPRSQEWRDNISKATIGKKHKPFTDEGRANMSKSQKGKKMPPRTDEHKQHLSAANQGIPYEEWDGFVANGAYCEKFDDACRERIREKYNHRCYICDKPQEENANKNGKVRKLDVHHVDKNKNQGCDGVQWKLIPLCMHCHPGSHHDPIKSWLRYLLDDEDV